MKFNGFIGVRCVSSQRRYADNSGPSWPLLTTIMMMSLRKYLQPLWSFQKYQLDVRMLVLLLVKCLLITGFVWAGDLSVVNDEEIIRLHGPGSAKKSVSTVETRPSRSPDSAFHQPAEDEKGELTLQQRQEELRTIQYPLETEQRLMADVIQPLERESASRWLAGFISSKPFDCPLKQQRQWIEAILSAVERNELPICKEILGLVGSIISIESGFHVDPLAVDPSRHESIKDQLQRAEEKFYQKYGSLMMIPPVPKLYASYKDKYYPRLLACSTRGGS